MFMFMFMIHPVWARLKLALTLAILCEISSAILNDVNSGISNYIEARILKISILIVRIRPVDDLASSRNTALTISGAVCLEDRHLKD